MMAQFLSQCKVFVETLPSPTRAAVQEVVQPKALPLSHPLHALDVVLPKPKPALKRKLTRDNAQQSADVRPAKRCQRSGRHLSMILGLGASDIQIPQRNVFTPLAGPGTLERPYIGCIIAQIYEELRLIEERAVQDPIHQRICAVALFDLHCRTRKASRSLAGTYFTSKNIASTSQVLLESGIVHKSQQEVCEWVKLYLKFDRRMKAIADRNGGLGALIIIPGLGMTPQQ